MSLYPNKIHPSWNEFLTNEIKNEISNIESKIGNNYFPLPCNVLRFLSIDLNNIKCVIVGMEPYPTDYETNNKRLPIATGRSFEVSNVNDWSEKFKQSSLRNILKTVYYNKTGEIISLEEIRNKIQNDEFKILQPKDWFDDLESQGVLFLNATLTVEKENVDSHTKIWNEFITKLIIYINKKQNVKWLLWGNKAQERICPLVGDNAICTLHPRIAQFVKENCFEKVKEIEWCGRCK